MINKQKIIKIFVIGLILFGQTVNANEFECNFCNDVPKINNTSILDKITGRNFIKKEIYERYIEFRLKKTFNGKIHARLRSFNYNALSNGEFKELIIEAKNISYKFFHAQNITAKTLCNYNKVQINNNKITYVQNIPFEYNAIITNENISNIINSNEFQKEINENKILLNNKEIFKILSPTVQIKNSQLFFDIPIKILFIKKPINIKFFTDIEIQNDEILLKNIIFSKNSNIIDNNLLIMIGNELNPIKFALKAFDLKKYTLTVENAQINGDKININGKFVVNKN